MDVDDTVDIIDLIAVVWRYRRVIVVVTVLAIAGGWLYTVVSGDRGEEAPPSYQVEAVLFFEPFVQTAVQGNRAPTVVRSYSDVASRLVEAMSNPTSLQNMVEATQPELPLPADSVVTALRSVTLEREGSDPYILTLSLRHSQDNVASEAATRALSLLESRLESLGLGGAEESGRPMFYVLQPPKPPTRITVEQDGSDPVMVIGIAGFTGFFLALLLSFLLSYISRVRQDPEAMAKLREASRRRQP